MTTKEMTPARLAEIEARAHQMRAEAFAASMRRIARFFRVRKTTQAGAATA